MKPEERRLAIVSTAHVTFADNCILERLPAKDHKLSGFLGATEYGWWFSNHRDVKEWQALGLSMTTWEILSNLFSRGFDRVEFDRDAPKLPEFPQFQW